jgi:hypothetical protein
MRQHGTRGDSPPVPRPASVETVLRQIANQIVLQERAARLVARNLAALHERARKQADS